MDKDKEEGTTAEPGNSGIRSLSRDIVHRTDREMPQYRNKRAVMQIQKQRAATWLVLHLNGWLVAGTYNKAGPHVQLQRDRGRYIINSDVGQFETRIYLRSTIFGARELYNTPFAFDSLAK